MIVIVSIIALFDSTPYDPITATCILTERSTAVKGITIPIIAFFDTRPN
jgi:hypothetical protein